MVPTATWAAVKADYLAGNGSFRELAERHGVSFHSLAKRAKRENWRGQMAKLGQLVATEATKEATHRGRSLGMNAAALIERTLSDVPAWLDRIEALAKEGAVDPQALRSLISSWRDVIQTGRQTLRLDEPGQQDGWRGQLRGRIIDIELPLNAPQCGDSSQSAAA